MLAGLVTVAALSAAAPAAAQTALPALQPLNNVNGERATKHDLPIFGDPVAEHNVLHYKAESERLRADMLAARQATGGALTAEQAAGSGRATPRSSARSMPDRDRGHPPKASATRSARRRRSRPCADANGGWRHGATCLTGRTRISSTSTRGGWAKA